MNDLARKYRGEFTSSDYFNANWMRMFVFNFTEFFGMSKISLQKDLSNAFRGMFRGALSSFALNGVAVQGSLYYAATTTNFRKSTAYLEYMTKVTISSVLLFPLQVMAMWNYRSMLGYGSSALASTQI